MKIVSECKADGWGEYDFYVSPSSHANNVAKLLTEHGFMVGGGNELNRVTIAIDTQYRSDIHAAREIIAGYAPNAISPTGIAEFDRNVEKRHLYEMSDGSQKRLTLAEATRLMIADGAAPFLLCAPKSYMPNTNITGAEGVRVEGADL